MLISLFLNGKLPWFDARSDAECKSRKIACDIKALSSQNNCPEVTTQNTFDACQPHHYVLDNALTVSYWNAF